MKKKILLLLLACVMLSGCWVYGSGSTQGYVTTVEDGIFWNVVFIRADYTSSNTDGYLISKSNIDLKDRLLQTSIKKQRIKMDFRKHISAASMASADEVVGFEIL